MHAGWRRALESASSRLHFPSCQSVVTAAQRSSSLPLPSAQHMPSQMPLQRTLVLHLPRTFGLTSAVVAGQNGLGDTCGLAGGKPVQPLRWYFDLHPVLIRLVYHLD